MKEAKKKYAGLGLLGIVLCAACCSLPILGAMAGVGTLSVLSKYFEWAGIAAIVLSLVFFVVYLVRKNKTANSNGECGCNTKEAALIDFKMK